MRAEYTGGQRNNHPANPTASPRSTSNRTGLGAAAAWTLMGTALLAACAHDKSSLLDTDSGGGHDGSIGIDQFYLSMTIVGTLMIVTMRLTLGGILAIFNS